MSSSSSVRAMQNQEGNYVRPRIFFAELEMEERRVECPLCHVQFCPHLGNLIAEKFQCGSCKSYLTYRNKLEPGLVRCPPCGLFRPLPNMDDLKMLFCDGCDEKIIFEKGVKGVQCAICKHITDSQDENCRVREIDGNFDMVPRQVNRVVPDGSPLVTNVEIRRSKRKRKPNPKYQ